MASVTFRNGFVVSDDSDVNTGLKNGGHRLRFIPALIETVAVAAEAKDWANKVGSVVYDLEYSAKEYATGNLVVTGGSSKNWASLTGAMVSGDYSAKEYAIGALTISGGSAKAWATKTSATVDATEYSAKEWAIGTTVPSISAKQWAIGVALPNGNKSAKTYADEALISAQSAVNTPATSATSTTSNTIPTAFPASLTYTIQTGKGFVVGQFVIAASTASPANYVIGQITAHNPATGSITISVAASTATGGSGTFTSWNIALTALANVAGAALLSGANTFTNATNTFQTIIVNTNIGVGTSSPASRVHVNSATATDVFSRFSNSSSTTGLEVGVRADGAAVVAQRNASNLVFLTNNTERLTITSSGLIGVNKTPISAVDILANNDKLRVTGTGDVIIETSNSTNNGIGLWPGAINTIYSSSDLTIRTGVVSLNGKSAPTGGNNSVTITSSGQVNVSEDASSGNGLTRLSQIQALLAQVAPPGMVSAFASSVASDGWLYCDGRTVSRTVYAALFAKIGTLYGVGDGSTTFNLPDYRGEFLRGFSDSRANVDVGRVFPQPQLDLLGRHSHGYLLGGSNVNQIGGNQTDAGDANRGLPTLQTTEVGGNETRPRNLPVYYFIKT
jgi:Phage Tail Collar Domain